MSSHSYKQNRTDEETTNTMDFVAVVMLFILVIGAFACGYYLRAAQDAAWLSEALSK